MGIGFSIGHLLIISVTLRACVASMGFVILLIENLTAYVFLDLQESTRGIGVQAVKGILPAESCESRDGSVKYTMVTVSNTVWEDSPFSILSLLSNENCQAACLRIVTVKPLRTKMGRVKSKSFR